MPEPPALSCPDQVTKNAGEFSCAGSTFTLLLGATESVVAATEFGTIGGSKLPIIGVANSARKLAETSAPSGVGVNG